VMVRWMCSVTLRSKVSSDKLPSRVVVSAVFRVARHNRFIQVGHVEGMPDDDD